MTRWVACLLVVGLLALSGCLGNLPADETADSKVEANGTNPSATPPNRGSDDAPAVDESSGDQEPLLHRWSGQLTGGGLCSPVAPAVAIHIVDGEPSRQVSVPANATGLVIEVGWAADEMDLCLTVASPDGTIHRVPRESGGDPYLRFEAADPMAGTWSVHPTVQAAATTPFQAALSALFGQDVTGHTALE
jgi:hypothetical protein